MVNLSISQYLNCTIKYSYFFVSDEGLTNIIFDYTSFSLFRLLTILPSGMWLFSSQVQKLSFLDIMIKWFY